LFILDDDNNTNNQSMVEMTALPSSSMENNNLVLITEEISVIQATTHIDMSLNQYTDPLYSSSSSTNSNTPISTDLISTIDNPNEQEDIWNIFEELSSQMNSDSIQQHDHHSIHYHPYKSYSSTVQSHIPSIYQSFLTPYPYPSHRTFTNRRRLQRRKCYGCRQQGHLRKECPYFSQD